jgi:DNA repair exonuclease SbcCD ATPase subunit
MRAPPLALCLIAAVVLAGVASTVAPAQTLDDKLRAELTSVLAQLHDLQNNQAALDAQKAAAEHERDALKAKLAKGGGAALRAPSPALQGELTAEQAKTAQLTDALQQAQADLAKYKDALSQAAQAAQQTKAERDRLALVADTGSRALANGQAKNVQLLAVGHEILTAYEHVGVGQAIARGEPVLGLERAKLERIAQGYGDELYGAKFDAHTVKPGPPSAAPAAAAPTSH